MEKFVNRYFFYIMACVVAVFVALVWSMPSHAAAPIPFTIPTAQGSSQSTLTAPVPGYTDALVLLANSSQTQAIPAGSHFVVFSAGCNFFAAPGASASVPGASTSDGSAPQQNPQGWWLTGQTQITVVAASACIVTLSFYQ